MLCSDMVWPYTGSCHIHKKQAKRMESINGYVMVHENVNTSIETRISIIAISLQFCHISIFFFTFPVDIKWVQFICIIYMENFLSHRALVHQYKWIRVLVDAVLIELMIALGWNNTLKNVRTLLKIIWKSNQKWWKLLIWSDLHLTMFHQGPIEFRFSDNRRTDENVFGILYLSNMCLCIVHMLLQFQV